MNRYFVKEFIQDMLWMVLVLVIFLSIVVPLGYYTVQWLMYWFP